jgi:uncharacterized protein YcbK (DUF882 family)
MKPLTLEAYLMGREKLYPSEFTLDVKMNALDLIKRVNNLLNALQIDCPVVTSGWRPLAVNVKAGGAKRSLHMSGKAVDLLDLGQPGEVEKRILAEPHLLLDFGLWMEAPDSTLNWIHLDSGLRDARLIRVFKP